MAMTSTAPMSSTIASAARNTLNAERDPVAQQRQHAEGEGDVRRHGDAPAAVPRPAGVQRRVEQRRHDHSAERSRDGQRRLPDGGELAGEHLALDLEADDEEEHRHQPVVDQMVQRDRRGPGADGETERRLPEMLVGLRSRGSWPSPARAR